MTEQSFILGGILRTFPEDFLVEEVWNNYTYKITYSFHNRIKDYLMLHFQQKQAYLHFTLVKKIGKLFVHSITLGENYGVH